MNDTVQNRVPLLLWPFYAIWKLVTIILGVTGRIVCALLGIALMVAGMAISLTVIGAVLARSPQPSQVGNRKPAETADATEILAQLARGDVIEKITIREKSPSYKDKE